MKALQLVLIALIVASAVASDVELDKPKGKSDKKSTKKPAKVLKPRYFVPRSEVVIVPKGDPRARAPVMIPAPLPVAVQQPIVQPPTPFPQPTQQPTTPAARPLLKAGTPTSAACAQRRGTCKASSSCTGNFQIVRGICAGPATITCCVPKTAGTTTTPKPGSTTTTTTPASQCPVYANAPESSIKGNGNVMYRVVRIAAQHFTGSADNTMTKATACAFARMAQDAARAGIRLTINSGFRTYERQLYFWNCFQTKRCNNGNRAARPGNSNHGRGQALDINTGATSTATYRWMAANASKYGFRRTVSDEPWHWER